MDDGVNAWMTMMTIVAVKKKRKKERDDYKGWEMKEPKKKYREVFRV